MASAFSLLELLVVLAVVAVLVALQLPVLARGQGQSRQVQCAANLRQNALAQILYGNENNNLLPLQSSGSWPWDVPVSFSDQLAQYGAARAQFYCPASPEQNADGLWNYSSYRITGYALTLPPGQNILSSLLGTTNNNASFDPGQFLIFPGGILVRPVAANRVLVADAIISSGRLPWGSTQTMAQKLASPPGPWSGIAGGYNPPGWQGHRTSHLDFNGQYPAGGNVAMLDGHLEWRTFADVLCRTSQGPGFWW